MPGSKQNKDVVMRHETASAYFLGIQAIRSVHEETSLSSLFHRTVPSTPVVEAVRSTGIDSSLMTLS